MVRSFGDEQFAGCTGCPADSHVVLWQRVSILVPWQRMTLISVQMSLDRPVARCPECGSVYKMEYVGPPLDAHDDRKSRPHCSELKMLTRPKMEIITSMRSQRTFLIL